MIAVTQGGRDGEEAAREARHARAALRLGIRGGGCSGFSYVIEFHDDPPRERDRVFEFDERASRRVVVDQKSLIYSAATVLDWEQTLMYQGFKFVNPHEKTAAAAGTPSPSKARARCAP